jgi:hypothetical protein
VFLGIGEINEGEKKENITGNKSIIFRLHTSLIMEEKMMRNKMI